MALADLLIAAAPYLEAMGPSDERKANRDA
jgi:hypothetical protein